MKTEQNCKCGAQLLPPGQMPEADSPNFNNAILYSGLIKSIGSNQVLRFFECGCCQNYGTKYCTVYYKQLSDKIMTPYRAKEKADAAAKIGKGK